MAFYPSNGKINGVLLVAIIILSLLSISWYHQIYTLYRQIKRADIDNRQIVALNKQLRSERSQVMSGGEIKQTAINLLKMKKVEQQDKGKWFRGKFLL
jgi:cell division protein FtsL